LTRRSTFYAGALPDRITIYRRAICAVCNSDSEVVEQVLAPCTGGDGRRR